LRPDCVQLVGAVVGAVVVVVVGVVSSVRVRLLVPRGSCHVTAE
jgi:hypothetical protein